MPERDDTPPMSAHSLPPSPLSAAEIFQQFLPQVIKTAADSAASSSAASAALASMEAQLSDMRISMDNNTAALQRMVDAKEKENELLAEKNRLLGRDVEGKAEKDQRWHETIRSMFPGPVVAQIIIQALMFAGLALGLYQALPVAYPGPSSGTLTPSTSEHGSVPTLPSP